MMRRACLSSGLLQKSASLAPTALALQASARHLTIGDCPFWSEIGNHVFQLIYPTTYTTLPALAYSPLGTIALIGLAYNVSVIGTKHCWYTMDLTARDYLQDQKVAMMIRYVILLTILFSVEALFVEN